MHSKLKQILRRGSSMLRRYYSALSKVKPKRGVWALGLAIFLTSVTIAAIIPRDNDTLSSSALVPLSPPQSLQWGEKTLTDEPNAHPNEDFAFPKETLADKNNWKTVLIRKGDTVSEILKRGGYDSGQINLAIASNPNAQVFRQLYPGRALRLHTDRARLLELVYETDGETFHLVRHADRFELTKELRSFETRLAHMAGTIESSLFEDGQDAGLSDALIMQLVEIFGWDIDFALDLRRGDSFSVIHEEKYWQGQKIADGPIIAAEFINQGHVFRAIAYRDANGYASYFTPEGTSMRRPFLRTPVEFSRITSRFSSGRLHPILKTWRAHKGVDYAAPQGTPVHATSDGRVLSMGWNGGYGQRIVIRHNAVFSTIYAHLSRYSPNLHVGSFIKQGQTIGYVGATGLATGPHLHYEFQVNGEHRNPLTYKFPGATSIALEHRDNFARLAKTWSARLDIISHGVTVVTKQ